LLYSSLTSSAQTAIAEISSCRGQNLLQSTAVVDLSNSASHFATIVERNSRKRHATFDDGEQSALVKEKRSRLPETCEWIMREPAYKSWTNHQNENVSPVLWIHGPSGWCKTFLAQYIVECLKSNPDQPTTVCYFCDRFRTPDAILRSILDQILQILGWTPESHSTLKRILDGTQAVPFPTDESFKLLDEFSAIPKTDATINVILDGLDELPSRYRREEDSPPESFDLLEKLLEAVSTKPGGVRLLVSTKAPPNLLNGCDYYPSILVDPERVKEDLERFISSEVDQYQVLLQCKDRVVATVLEQADGNFIWAGLTVKYLGLKTKPGDKVELNITSSSVGDAYARLCFSTIKLVTGTKAKIRHHILEWVVSAVRPIRLSELSNALTFGANLFIPNIEARPMELCSPLVEVSDGALKIVHHSVGQFFESNTLEINGN
jgi:hypothetical protein